jgi:hypothetical protein
MSGHPATLAKARNYSLNNLTKPIFTAQRKTLNTTLEVSRCRRYGRSA